MKNRAILFQFYCIILLLVLFVCEVRASTDTLRLGNYGVSPNDDIEDAKQLNDLIEKYRGDSVVIEFDEGRYKFEVQVKTYFDQYVKLVGGNNTIVYPAKSFKGYSLIFGYNLDVVNITIDGMDRIARGVIISNRGKLIDSKIINFNSPRSKMSRGLIYGEIGDSLYVYNCEFRNIGGLEDGKIGNGVGSHRAIVVKGRNTFIDSCRFEDIHGVEDGDIIHVNSSIDSNGNWTSLGGTVIKNCMFKAFGKRAIKVQASGVHIVNCKFVSSEESSANGPRNVVSLMGGSNFIKGCNIDVRAISHVIIVHSDSNIIEGNTISVHNRISSSRVRGSMIHGIKVYGNYNTIKSNKIRFNSLGVSVQIKKGKGNIVTGNSIESVRSPIVSDKENNEIEKNTVRRIDY